MPTLEIVTHHSESFGRNYQKTCDSVLLAQSVDPVAVYWSVVPNKFTNEEFIRDRYRAVTECAHPAAKDAKWVAFVDDDDTVTPDAFAVVLQAIAANPDAGLLFTQKDVTTPDGIRQGAQAFTYENMVLYPSLTNHLAVFRRDAVPVDALNLALECGVGIEWIMRCYAAFRHGAVRIKHTAYTYSNLDAPRRTNTPQLAQAYSVAMPKIREVFAPMIPEVSEIPTWGPH